MSAEPYLPKRKTLNTLNQAVQDCKGCSLWQHATQAVLGEGTTKAHLLFVGEYVHWTLLQQGVPALQACP